jgi:hypothetical protein
MIPAPPRSIQFRGNVEILPISDANANEAIERESRAMRGVFGRLIENADTQKWERISGYMLAPQSASRLS